MKKNVFVTVNTKKLTKEETEKAIKEHKLFIKKIEIEELEQLKLNKESENEHSGKS